MALEASLDYFALQNCWLTSCQYIYNLMLTLWCAVSVTVVFLECMGTFISLYLIIQQLNEQFCLQVCYDIKELLPVREAFCQKYFLVI